MLTNCRHKNCARTFLYFSVVRISFLAHVIAVNFVRRAALAYARTHCAVSVEAFAHSKTKP